MGFTIITSALFYTFARPNKNRSVDEDSGPRIFPTHGGKLKW